MDNNQNGEVKTVKGNGCKCRSCNKILPWNTSAWCFPAYKTGLGKQFWFCAECGNKLYN